jgi:ATP synthase protein I
MHSSDVAILKGAAMPTAVVGALAVVLGGIFAGSKGALGALIGALLVVIFFTIGQGVLSYILRTNAEMATTFALALYLVKIGVLFGFLILFQDTTAFNTKVFALTVLACTLVWTTAEVMVFSRQKVLYVEPGSGPGSGPGREPAERQS